MKIVPLLAAIVCSALSAYGQSPSPAPSDTPAKASHDRAGTASITPDEVNTLRAANAKAQQDPTVLAAIDKMKAAGKAADDAMIAKDSSLAPLLAKAHAPKAPGAQRPEFSVAERAQLTKARDSIKGTPEADALREAIIEYRATLHNAMIAADPAVAVILAKLPQGPMGRPSPKPAAGASQ